MMKDRNAEHGFSREVVRNLAPDPVPSSSAKVKLGPMAQAIASQYARNTNSPVMVSGTMRIIEFMIVALTGLAVFVLYVGLSIDTLLQYFLAILSTATLSVVLLEFY
jgi:hypothetical protein